MSDLVLQQDNNEYGNASLTRQVKKHRFGHWSIEILVTIKQWIQIKELQNSTSSSALIFHSTHNYTSVQFSVAQELFVNFLNWQTKIKNNDGFLEKKQWAVAQEVRALPITLDQDLHNLVILQLFEFPIYIMRTLAFS